MVVVTTMMLTTNCVIFNNIPLEVMFMKGFVCLDSLAAACRWNSSGMEVQAVLLKYV